VLIATARSLGELESKAEPIPAHFDVDLVDFDDFPTADVPHKPGLDLLKTKEVLRVFLATPKAVGLVLTEFNPKRDGDAKLAPRLIDTMVGAIKQGKSCTHDDGLEKKRAADTLASRSTASDRKRKPSASPWSAFWHGSAYRRFLRCRDHAYPE
jgi:hypothetical protein